MEYINFPIVALGTALICLIGVSIYAIMQRGSLRSRDEQLVVARAQAYAMLELSQAGVLFLDREHKLMGEASAAAPELLGHTCAPGTAFVQAIADLVDVHVRRATVAYLESLWQAEPNAVVDATANPLQRVHSGSRHLAIRFARLVVDGRVHHIIASLEKISAPRIVPHTIEVPALNEETFAKRLAGETGTRPALNVPTLTEVAMPAAPVAAPANSSSAAPASPEWAPGLTSEFQIGPLDVTSDSLPTAAPPSVSLPALAQVSVKADAANAGAAKTGKIETMDSLTNSQSGEVLLPPLATAAAAGANTISDDDANHLATTITSPEAMGNSPKPAVQFDPAAIIEPRDPRLTEVLGEVMHVDAARLEGFLAEARDKAGQLRAIIKLPAREPQAFREKLVLILELIRGIHARAKRLPLPSVCERAQRFEEALNGLRDRQQLSGNDFLPLAVKLDDLLSHLAIQGEVVTRLREWRVQQGEPPASDIESTRRSATATGTTIRQPRMHREPPPATSATQKLARLSDLSQESLDEMAQFLADMYGKRVSLVVDGPEDVPGNYRRVIEKILGQLIHNAIRHGVEPPTDRALVDKPEIGTVAVQFAQIGPDGFQLSVQDDGRGLDHDKIRSEAVRQGVFTSDVAASIDPRKLANLIFRPGFTTVADGGARGNGMDVVREMVNKVGGRVGIATKPGEYTRFRVTLPHVKNASDAAVA